jgi:hypothetical protein
MKVLLDEGVEPFVCMPKQVEHLSGPHMDRKNKANRPQLGSVLDNPAISKS